MQKCFLVINKETRLAEYLEHRSILAIEEEHRSLSELDLEHLDIIDVDKLLYIYYQTDDGDLSFRSDMNALRVLTSSAFFHVSEVMFIFVDNKNPLLEDFVYSALRESTLDRSKINIISHVGALMFADVGRYLSGNASGQQTSSSYRDVYIREADKEEKERFTNVSDGIDSVLPTITDMSLLYQQRAEVEAISAGRVVSESIKRPQVVSDFTRVNLNKAKENLSFVVSGERWSNCELAVSYLINYFRSVGLRTLIVNIDASVKFDELLEDVSELSFMDIRVPITPNSSLALINLKFYQLGYVVDYIHNIQGVNNYIFFTNEDIYSNINDLVIQLTEYEYSVFVAHYNDESIRRFIDSGKKATALFLYFGKFYNEFDLKQYKDDLEGTIVAQFPVDDVDFIEFFDYSTGGIRNE